MTVLGPFVGFLPATPCHCSLSLSFSLSFALSLFLSSCQQQSAVRCSPRHDPTRAPCTGLLAVRRCANANRCTSKLKDRPRCCLDTRRFFKVALCGVEIYFIIAFHSILPLFWLLSGHMTKDRCKLGKCQDSELLSSSFRQWRPANTWDDENASGIWRSYTLSCTGCTSAHHRVQSSKAILT